MIQKIDRALCAFETLMVVTLTLAGLAMAFVQVVLRYLFNTGVHWLEAGLVTALVWAMLFGAVRAVREGSHPRVELLPAMMPPKIAAAMKAKTTAYLNLAFRPAEETSPTRPNKVSKTGNWKQRPKAKINFMDRLRYSLTRVSA